jgi:hypothetical protein
MAAGVGLVVLAVAPSTNANFSDTVRVPIHVVIQVPTSDGPIEPPTPSETPNGSSKTKQESSPDETNPVEPEKSAPPTDPTPESTATVVPEVTTTPSEEVSTDEISIVP